MQAESFIVPFPRSEAGGSPAASHFLCFAKESNQRKATPGSSPLRGSLRCSQTRAAAELVARIDNGTKG